MTQPCTCHCFADQWAIFRNGNFQREFTQIAKSLLITAIRQPLGKKQPDKKQPNHSDRKPHSSDRKQRKSRFTRQHLILTIDHQIGAGADKGQGTAQNCRIA